MTHFVRMTTCTVLGLLLSACLEPQTAPDLPERPLSDFNIETVADGLASPWAMAELPDGSLLVTGKLGKMWRVSDGTAMPVTGLPPELTLQAERRMATEGQGGLLDVALAPDFETSGTLFLSYSYGDWDSNGTALMRARLEDDRLVAAQTVFEAQPPKEAGSHFGGKIAFLSDDSLLLSLGDAFALREEAQKPTSHLGSVVRLTQDGGAAEGNPDFGAGALPEIWSVGHRNVQGLVVDPDTGTIWEHEHGPRGGDEINRLEAGANFGWPVATYGRDYQGARISPIEDHSGYAAPSHVWTPSIAPSGLAVYRGSLFPEWNGQLLIGGLASGDLRLVDPDRGGEVVLLSDAKTDEDAFRVRDVDVANDGSVLLLIEHPENGRIIRLRPAR